MAEKTSKQAGNEKIFTIPLSEAYKKSERKRAPYAMRYVREFLRKHTKTDNVKLGFELNKAVWSRGIRKPARSVRVKAIIEKDVVKAELVGFEFKEFKAKPKAEKKGAKEKLMERLGPKALQKEEEEKKIEGKAEEAKNQQEEKKVEKEIKEELKEAAEPKK